MARSPYFEAKVNRWCDKKRELVIDDCDLNTFNTIVDYMYGGLGCFSKDTLKKK